MKEKINLKSIIAALIILSIGVFLALMDGFVWKSESSIFLNIGCSFIASALAGLITVLLVERHPVNPLDAWKLRRIESTRAKINDECAEKLRKVKYQVDIVAFGLHTFRNKQSSYVENYLKKGINFRILTMDPTSPYVLQRECEEDDTSIKNSIEKLVEWANKLNSLQYKGKVIVKGYSCMTLDFYWRVDDTIYVGPYWYGHDSQQTITYAFDEGGEGFTLYAEYFEKLWDSSDLSRNLTTETKMRSPRR